MPEDVVIRAEADSDWGAVGRVHEEAFGDGGRVAALVADLRAQTVARLGRRRPALA